MLRTAAQPCFALRLFFGEHRLFLGVLLRQLLTFARPAVEVDISTDDAKKPPAPSKAARQRSERKRAPPPAPAPAAPAARGRKDDPALPRAAPAHMISRFAPPTGPCITDGDGDDHVRVDSPSTSNSGNTTPLSMLANRIDDQLIQQPAQAADIAQAVMRVLGPRANSAATSAQKAADEATSAREQSTKLREELRIGIADAAQKSSTDMMSMMERQMDEQRKADEKARTQMMDMVNKLDRVHEQARARDVVAGRGARARNVVAGALVWGGTDNEKCLPRARALSSSGTRAREAREFEHAALHVRAAASIARRDGDPARDAGGNLRRRRAQRVGAHAAAAAGQRVAAAEHDKRCAAAAARGRAAGGAAADIRRRVGGSARSAAGAAAAGGPVLRRDAGSAGSAAAAVVAAGPVCAAAAAVSAAAAAAARR